MTPRKRQSLSKTPPPPEALSRLERLPGTARQWRDPITGLRYSNRKRQEAYQGNITIEKWRDLRRENPAAAKAIQRSRDDYRDGTTRRREAGGPQQYFINYGHMAELYANAQGMDVDEAYDSEEFWAGTELLEGLLHREYSWDSIADDLLDLYGTDDRDEIFHSGDEQ